MSQQPRKSSSSTLLLLALLPILAAGFFTIRMISGKSEDQGLDSSGFNLREKPDTHTKAGGGYVSKFEQETNARQSQSGAGLGGFVTETSNIYQPGKAPMSKREQEQEFIRKYDHLIRKEQSRLGAIGQEYRKKYAIVREVDLEFGKLPRYMNANAEYAKDRDAYKWARTVIGLPEVRRTISKHAKNPKVWKVAVEMCMDALKKPPPKAVHDEMVRFMTTDGKMTDYVQGFTKEVIPNMANMVKQAAPQGADLGKLSSIGSAITGMQDPLKKKKKSKKRKRSEPTAGSKR
ncbi:MAG: hypothetical protein ABIJ96_08920 [Elusimicrobiota bacterium]